MWRRMSPVRTDVSEERIASIIMVGRIRELGTSLTSKYIPDDGVLRDDFRFAKRLQTDGSRSFSRHVVSHGGGNAGCSLNPLGVRSQTLQFTALMMNFYSLSCADDVLFLPVFQDKSSCFIWELQKSLVVVMNSGWTLISLTNLSSFYLFYGFHIWMFPWRVVEHRPVTH
jgi:hypothetical protein